MEVAYYVSRGIFCVLQKYEHGHFELGGHGEKRYNYEGNDFPFIFGYDRK